MKITLTSINEIADEAIFLKQTNPEYSFAEIRAFVEFGRAPLTEMEWDHVLYALDMDEMGRQEHEVSKYDDYSFEGYGDE